MKDYTVVVKWDDYDAQGSVYHVTGTSPENAVVRALADVVGLGLGDQT